jgi:hypothetical protein
VPAFAALGSAERLSPFGAGRAGIGEGVAAGDQDLLDLAGVQVGAAELNGPDTAVVLDGQRGVSNTQRQTATDSARQRTTRALQAQAEPGSGSQPSSNQIARPVASPDRPHASAIIATRPRPRPDSDSRSSGRAAGVPAEP